MSPWTVGMIFKSHHARYKIKARTGFSRDFPSSVAVVAAVAAEAVCVVVVVAAAGVRNHTYTRDTPWLCQDWCVHSKCVFLCNESRLSV